MGAEALCRGAAEVVGIEKNGRACGIIRQNWQQVAQPQQEFKVLRGDAIARLQKLAGQSFDCIYFDPPYRGDLYYPVLSAIATLDLLSPHGEIAVEHNALFNNSLVADWVLGRHKQYSSTEISFFQHPDSN